MGRTVGRYTLGLPLPARRGRGSPGKGFPAIRVCGSLSSLTLLGGLLIRYFVTGAAGLAAGAEGASVEAGFNRNIMTCIHHERCFRGARLVARSGQTHLGTPGGPGAAGRSGAGEAGGDVRLRRERGARVPSNFRGFGLANTSGSPDARDQRGGTRRRAAQAPEGSRTRLAPVRSPRGRGAAVWGLTGRRRRASAARRPRATSPAPAAPADIGDGARRLRPGPRGFPRRRAPEAESPHRPQRPEPLAAPPAAASPRCTGTGSERTGRGRRAAARGRAGSLSRRGADSGE